MTWTKLGTEFFKECMHHGLSDAMVRTHCEGIDYLYSVEESSLLIPKRLVRAFTGSEQAMDAIASLVTLEWWADAGDKWLIVHHADVIRQSIAAQQKQRATSKATSAKYRAKKADADTDVTTGVTRHVTPDADRQTDRHLRQGSKETCKHGVRTEFWTCTDCTKEASA